MEKLSEAIAHRLRIESSLIREVMAEFAGTLLFLLIGISANIQTATIVAIATQNNATQTTITQLHSSSHLGNQLGWGFGLALGVYLALQISGAHLNPAITFAQLLRGAISPLRFLLYIPAQLIGAFLGAALAFLGHFEDCSLIRSQRGDQELASQFATYPRDGLSIYGSILDQLFGTALLAAGLWAITDKRNRVPSGFIPLLAGLILTMISLTFGLNGGFAINPARDLGPRLFMLSIGLGWGMFSNNNFYFWIPLAVPFVGALIGAFVYNLLIGVHGLDEQIEISGANYPRENDRGYKEYNSNPASVGVTSHLVSYSSTINR
uniref:Aquaporin n=1 Tax=Meloidogyne incognita TaxID=6306 RepID=A0A914LB98_MELIC